MIRKISIKNNSSEWMMDLEEETVDILQMRILTFSRPSGGGGGGITPPPPEHIVAHYPDISTSSQNSFRDFSWICFLHGIVLCLGFLWLRVLTPWRVKVTSYFREMEISISSIHIYMIGNSGKLNETWVVSLKQQTIMMTWRDSWQYVITWHPWHDVKAWLHKHKVGYLTSPICRCKWTRAMILLMFSTIFRSRDTFWLSRFAWPPCLTLKLKVTTWSTWLLLSLLVFVLPRWLICCFVMF